MSMGVFTLQRVEEIGRREAPPTEYEYATTAVC